MGHLKNAVLAAASADRNSLREKFRLGRSVASAQLEGSTLKECFEAQVLSDLSAAEKATLFGSKRPSKKAIRGWEARLSKAQTVFLAHVVPALPEGFFWGTIYDGDDLTEGEKEHERTVQRTVTELALNFVQRGTSFTELYNSAKKPQSETESDTTEGGESVSEENAASPKGKKGATKGGKKGRKGTIVNGVQVGGTTEGGDPDVVSEGNQHKTIRISDSVYRRLVERKASPSESMTDLIQRLLDAHSPSGRSPSGNVSSKPLDTAQA